MYWGPKILIAILILVATWIVARAVKWVLQKAIDRTPRAQEARDRHARGDRRPPARHDRQADHLAGRHHGRAAASSGSARSSPPINELVTEIFAFLPRLIGAGLIFFVGLIVARIVQRLVETVLIAANVDGLLARIGIGDDRRHGAHRPDAVPPGATPGATRASLARAAGVLVFALIIIPVAIAALQVLGIEAISGPAIDHAQRDPMPRSRASSPRRCGSASPSSPRGS